MTQANIYEGVGAAPAQDAVTVTPSDATVYSPILRSLRIGTTGDVAVVTSRGTTLTIPGVLAGEILPIHVTQVLATGTTASGITGFYG